MYFNTALGPRTSFICIFCSLGMLRLPINMARNAVVVALFAVLAASATAADANRSGRKLKGLLPGGGLTTSLPVGIPSLPTGSILPLNQITTITSLPVVQPVLNSVKSLVDALGLGGLLGGLLQFSTPQLGPLAPIGIDLRNILTPGATPQPDANTPKNGTFLYIWAGFGKTFTDPLVSTQQDFLATADLTYGSPTYGKIIQVTRVPTIGNEPHHIGISFDRKTILGSGLLSFLKLQDDIFQFDITDPRRPKFVKSINPPRKAVSDHVLGIKPGLHPKLPDGGFLTTQMGSDIGGAPGGISLYNPNLEVVAQYPQDSQGNDNVDGDYPKLDPHGAAVHLPTNSLVTSDFILPVSTVTANVATYPIANQLLNNSDITPLGNIVGRDTVHVWDFDTIKLRHIIKLEGASGSIDVKFIGGTQFAYATDVLNNALFVVDVVAGTSQKVLQFEPETHPHLLAEDPNAVPGTRFLLSLNLPGKVLYLDTSDFLHPKVLDVLDLGSAAKPHYITPLGPGDNRFAIADYFLDQGAVGVVHDIGNRKIVVVEIKNDKFKTDKAVQFYFADIPARPHGIASYTQSIDLVY